MVLNKEQKEIVTAPVGSILIRAAAGTGKTRVLSERIVHLIQKLNVDPEQILAITFTNIAADEMKERLHKRLKDANQIPCAIGTIHSIFGEILRRDIEQICPHRKHNFEILQDDGQNWALRQAFKDLNLPSFKHKTECNRIKTILSEWKTDRFLNVNTLDPEKLEKWEPVFLAYEEVLKRKNLLDFDDILILATQLLQQHKHIKDFWAQKYSAILIDEVQDLNEIQWRLVKNLINTENANFLAVGDPNQCIYIFNRAKENIFDEISQSFPNLMSYELTQNYRSAQKIVEFCNEIKQINCCQAVSNSQAQGLVERHPTVQNALKELLEEQDYSKWAILFPKHSNVKETTDLLIKHNIPFKTSRFYLLENKYIEKLITMLKAIFFDNSKLIENVICMKEFQISAYARKEILNHENWNAGESLTDFLIYGDDWKNLCLNSIDMNQLSYCIQKIKEFRELTDEKLASLIPPIQECIFKNTRLTPSTIHKIDLFIEWLQNIQSDPASDSSQEIVMNFNHYSEFSKENIIKKTNNSVTLSTIHRSKGLEWNKIIVLEWGWLQNESKEKSKDKHLAYVAATRAQDKLYLVD